MSFTLLRSLLVQGLDSFAAAAPMAEFSTLQSIRPHTVVEPLVLLPRLTGSGLAASQKGLYWCAVGLALVSTPGPYGS